MPTNSEKLADLSTAVVFSAKLSGNQSIPTGVHTPITAGVELFDTALAYNPANGRFVAPKSGYYQLNGIAEFTAASNNGSSCSIRINGSTYYTGSNNKNDISMTSKVGCSVVVQMASGDYAEFCAYQDTGSPLNVQAGSQFSGCMVHIA